MLSTVGTGGFKTVLTADLLELDVDEVLFELAEHDGFPRRALESAVAHQDAVAPAFMEAIEAYLTIPDLNQGEEPAVFFMVHLLAQFRERQAYPLLMRLFSLHPDRLHRILGNATTETLPRITISVFDGDPRPML